nr:tRNA adenosine(34) deaminase TadA [Thermoleptolyngbya oregonensis]
MMGASEPSEISALISESISKSIYHRHCRWMQQAIALAAAAGQAGEVPVGAVVVAPDNTLLATGENRRERDHDPTAHAEVLALRQAGQRLGTWRLEDCTLYVTLEPCPMCAGAIALARLGMLVYGADDPKAGAIRTVLNLPDSAASNHSPRVLSGVLEAACRAQLQQWFAKRRGNG